jgi:beta-xylosidase
MKAKQKIKNTFLILTAILGFSLHTSSQNPVITEKYTADPAAIVHNDTVYLYAGHDEAAHDFHFYNLNEWLIYSSTDMVNWREEGNFPVTEFEWARGDAWAAEVIEKDGKFYWYVTVHHKDVDGKAGKAIGVLLTLILTGTTLTRQFTLMTMVRHGFSGATPNAIMQNSRTT